MRTIAHVFVMAALLVAVSCSPTERADTGTADPTAPVAATESPEPEQASGPTPTDRPEQSGPATAARSPLEKAFGLVLSPEVLVKTYNELGDKQADAIATCIKAEGFTDYYELPGNPLEESDFEDTWGATTDLEENGYWVVANLRTAPVSVTMGDATESDGYFASLSESDQAVFGGVYNSCSREAYEKFPDPFEPSDAAYELLDEFESDWAESAIVTEVWDDWSDCMKGTAGFDYATRYEAEQDLNDRASPLSEEILRAAVAEDEAGRTFEFTEFEDRIAEFAELEKVTVAADLACTAQVDLVARIDAARLAAETEFVDDNGDRIALLLTE